MVLCCLIKEEPPVKNQVKRSNCAGFVALSPLIFLAVMTSRAELLAWVNDLLQINYTKVRCSLLLVLVLSSFTSPFFLSSSNAVVVSLLSEWQVPLMPKSLIQFTVEDVPLSRVKMNANQEYEYLNNFKVIQAAFKKHQIDKPVPVTALIKCKMQDNLEFMQWLKKYWDMHYPGGHYDAVARRKGAPADPNPLIASAPKTASNGAGRTAKALGTSIGQGFLLQLGMGARTTSRTGNSLGTQKEIENLTTQLEEFKLSMEGLEKERDFYFNKLRDIEILIGARVDSKDGKISESEMENLKQVQAILYSTEEGFEVPELDPGLVDEEETF
ncbi:RP/EB family microtubule-associated protein [Puccinia sorghi]|uniref:RP/EB family microtubule-associated protein n=1 Tax=Puccinia sorghi TaxID=27349 RepID=A0A0L6V8Z8_9BASI|nr:RP/EB family microtubule-associated protein [Puccinia sorghi]